MAARIRIPRTINGVRVQRCTGEDVVVIGGEQWVTLVPINDEDARIWEFSKTTGRIIQTQEA